MSSRLSARLLAPLLTLVLALGTTTALVPTATAAPASGTTSTTTTAPPSGWIARGEDHPQVATRSDVRIPLSDGGHLFADLRLPADADGTEIPGSFPVIVTITAYNKTVMAAPTGGLGGTGPEYLVKRGYAHLMVDARGTGSSPGAWQIFSERERQDAGEVVTWAANQEWSDGNVGMNGPSYMGITQINAASERPEGLRAIFPQVPGADVYRDVVATGGQIDVGFMPLWLGLVTATGVIPPAAAAHDPTALLSVVDHLLGAVGTTVPLILGALLGSEPAYDGPFYQERSPIEVIDRVDVPTFFIGGQYDLFQRGTPLLFESLNRRGVPTKMIFGPWDHLQGSGGGGVGDAGHGSLSELQLRWFDHYVRGVPDPHLDTDIPPLTFHEIGTGSWHGADRWIDDATHDAVSFRLSGSATPALARGGLTTGAAPAGTVIVPPVPLAGLCTRSANQWTAGLPSMILADLPCFHDNQWNDHTGVVFETDPLAEDLRFQGPLNAKLHVSSVSGGGLLSVSVSDVAPDGTVDRLTGGWMSVDQAALDPSRSRYLDGKVIQAWHPHTKASQSRLTSGEVREVDVEIFPTAARIKSGHRLRLAVQAFDLPHLLPTVPSLLGSALNLLTIHTSAEHPSELTVPALASDAPWTPPGPGSGGGTGDGGSTGTGTTTTASTASARATTRTRVRLKKKRTRVGARNRVIVQVRTAGGAAARGKVRVRVAGATVRTTRLNRKGNARIRLPKQHRAGRPKVVVRYLGNAATAPSRSTTRWRVRARLSE